MKNAITANELKTKGVSAIDMVVRESEEAVLTVRGKSTYVVMPIEKYNYYRECELETAINKTLQEIKQGKYVLETVDEHIKRITDA
ncbi:MAG: type II toxin-antitoxin system Phd/YefM family antitoxin [Firmicutes bacterium]|nr:type II toxin-antitoxin system Phd/YefM family antitoxin [Bacillota bacterium]